MKRGRRRRGRRKEEEKEEKKGEGDEMRERRRTKKIVAVRIGGWKSKSLKEVLVDLKRPLDQTLY